jgi:hypothetical protein
VAQLCVGWDFSRIRFDNTCGAGQFEAGPDFNTEPFDD